MVSGSNKGGASRIYPFVSENMHFQKVTFPLIRNDGNAIFRECLFSMVRRGQLKLKVDDHKAEECLLSKIFKMLF